MKLQHEHLLKGLEFALNYHGIDAKANVADFKLAGLLAPQVIHGAECAKTGADPAMTPIYKTVVTGKPTDIEALAQRLSKVEERIAANLSNINGRFEETSKRIDQACDIIGERISQLEERLNAVVDLLGESSRAPGALYYATRIAQLADALRELSPGWRGWKGSDLPFGLQPNPPGFPTGAGTTVEDAIAQVEEPGAEIEPLKPQRGDRVRLEGALSVAGWPIIDGWYDVVGHGELDFQIAIADGRRKWVPDIHPGLKEVRRGAALLSE